MRKEKKVKITVSLDRELVEWVEKEIKKKRFGSKSHAIELALYKLKSEEEPTGHAR